MMPTKSFKYLFIFTLLAVVSLVNLESVQTNDGEIAQSTKMLSRKKRFLIFPDGSSFQLVFCTQNHGYIQVGDIVWFATTAALAWELPSDPDLFNIFKKKSKFYGKEAQRRQDSKIVYFNEDGKFLAAVPYKKKMIVNPAFAKRSVNSQSEPMSIKELHEMQKNRSYLYNIEETSTEFHRQGRHSLYEKLETFFKGLGYSGNECVLRMLCESSRLKAEQGTFLEEIMRATFTFPRSSKSSEVFAEYDLAHGSTGDCSLLYPECKDLRGNPLYK